jgi:hypothetical protein
VPFKYQDCTLRDELTESYGASTHILAGIYTLSTVTCTARKSSMIVTLVTSRN